MRTGLLEKRVRNTDDQPRLGRQLVDQCSKIAVLHCKIWTHITRKGDLKKDEHTYAYMGEHRYGTHRTYEVSKPPYCLTRLGG